jgi:hypothetical protein
MTHARPVVAPMLCCALALLGAVTLLSACGSTQEPPLRPANRAVADFGRASQVPGTSTAPLPAPARTAFRWYDDLEQARSVARSEGKLLLVATTRQGCGLCEKFINETVPLSQSELDDVAVGYRYDIEYPESRALDQTLRSNLQGAAKMPLVGFMNADLGWVHGFWGARNDSQFQGDITLAVSRNPVRALPPEAAPVRRGDLIAVRNEYGETEWVQERTDVWPEPEDAIPGAPVDEGGAVSTPGGDDVPPPAPQAPGGPGDLPSIEGADPDGLPAVDGPGVRAPDLGRPGRAPPEETPPVSPARVEDSADWAAGQLERARGQIASGDYGSARAALAEIRRRLPGTESAREAARGGVAIYNHRRIEAASEAERPSLRERALRDLGTTMWATLFR